MVKSFGVVVLGLAAAAAAHAQGPAVRTPVAVTPMADMQKWQTAMLAAQQASIKPGDEALPCDALQKELVSTMNSPAIQTHAAKTDEAYVKELAAQQKKGPMTAADAAALAAALTANMGPGLTGMPQVVPGQPMSAAQMQQLMAAQQQATIAYMNQLAPIMPALMRGQRVGLLGVMKSCPWATGVPVLPVGPGPIPRR